MRFDPTPLYRSTVGFDRLFNLLDKTNMIENSTPSYPPYNIERMDSTNYRISMAVAGFSEDDISIEVTGNALSIKRKHSSENSQENTESEILHRGIAARNFERRFELADHVEVKGAELKNGLLHIALEHRIPEEKKTKQIKITSSQGLQNSLKTVNELPDTSYSKLSVNENKSESTVQKDEKGSKAA